MKVLYQIFESTSKSWAALCDEASAFATQIGEPHLINISVSAAGGGNWGGGGGAIFVGYWSTGDE